MCPSVPPLVATHEAIISEGGIAATADQRIISYISVAFAVCAFYDFLTKLSKEIEVVGPAFDWQQIRRALHRQPTEWSRTRFVIRVMYILGRHIGVAHHIYMAAVFTSQPVERGLKTDRFPLQRGFAIVNGFLGTVVLCATQGLIALRIYRSLGLFNPKGKRALKYSFVLEVGVLLVMQVIACVEEVKVKRLEGDDRICSSGIFPDWMYTIWLPVLCFELELLSLAAKVVLEHHRLDETLRSTHTERHQGRAHAKSVSVILRDNVVSLLVLSTISIVNLSCRKLLGDVLPVQTSFALSTLGPILLGSQLLMNLHHARSIVDSADDINNGIEMRVMFVVHEDDSDLEPIPVKDSTGLYDASG